MRRQAQISSKSQTFLTSPVTLSVYFPFHLLPTAAAVVLALRLTLGAAAAAAAGLCEEEEVVVLLLLLCWAARRAAMLLLPLLVVCYYEGTPWLLSLANSLSLHCVGSLTPNFLRTLA